MKYCDIGWKSVAMLASSVSPVGAQSFVQDWGGAQVQAVLCTKGLWSFRTGHGSQRYDTTARVILALDGRFSWPSRTQTSFQFVPPPWSGAGLPDPMSSERSPEMYPSVA